MSAPLPQLYGLLLVGGESRRMQRDKALLEYHGEPQLRSAYRLLSGLLPRVFVSLRADQANEPVRATLPGIVDAYGPVGPAGGILSAQTAYPGAAWLVLACDLPLLDRECILDLLAARDGHHPAIAYRSTHDGLPEPLCAIWEPASEAALRQQLSRGGHVCPRKALREIDTLLLPARADGALDNINTPQEFEQARQRLEQRT